MAVVMAVAVAVGAPSGSGRRAISGSSWRCVSSRMRTPAEVRGPVTGTTFASLAAARTCSRWLLRHRPESPPRWRGWSEPRARAFGPPRRFRRVGLATPGAPGLQGQDDDVGRRQEKNVYSVTGLRDRFCSVKCDRMAAADGKLRRCKLVALAARGEVPAAFERRCIPPDGVVRRLPRAAGPDCQKRRARPERTLRLAARLRFFRGSGAEPVARRAHGGRGSA